MCFWPTLPGTFVPVSILRRARVQGCCVAEAPARLAGCGWWLLALALAGDSLGLTEEESWASAITEILQMSTPKRAQACRVGLARARQTLEV